MTVLIFSRRSASEAVDRRPHVIAKVARRGLDQDVLLPGEVAEERRPADVGVRDHVVDLRRRRLHRTRNRAIAASIDAVALLESTGWVGGAGIRAERASPLAYPTSAWSMSSCPFRRIHMQYGTVSKPYADMGMRTSLREPGAEPPSRPARGCRRSGHACGSPGPARTRSRPAGADSRPSARAGADPTRPAPASSSAIAAIELLPLDRAALRRDRGGDLAVARPAGEVGVRIRRPEVARPLP